MPNIDEHFSKGVVCSSDVEEWLDGEEPLQAYDAVSKLWDVHIKPPEMTLGERTEYSFADSLQKVSINFEQAVIWSKLFERLGSRQPFSSQLKADLGEQMTYYMSFNVNPEQHEMRDFFLEKFQQTLDIDDFIEYATIASKLQAIGSIGRRKVATDIPDYVTVSNNINKIYARKTDECLKDMIKMINLGVLKVEDLRQVTPVLMRNTTAGTGEAVLASRLEKQYKGRLPKLIRETGNAPFKEEYIGYVSENTPTYGRLLNANFRTDIF